MKGGFKINTYQEIGTVASSDSTSRYPVQNDDKVMEIFNITTSASLESLRIEDNISDDMGLHLASNSKIYLIRIRAVMWKVVKQPTDNIQMLELIDVIGTGFPENKGDLPTNLAVFWDHKNRLYTLNNVILVNERVIIPPKLRLEVLGK